MITGVHCSSFPKEFRSKNYTFYLKIQSYQSKSRAFLMICTAAKSLG